MTYHRTAGKGGTRNAPAGALPDFNKSKGSGRRRKGKMVANAKATTGNFPMSGGKTSRY